MALDLFDTFFCDSFENSFGVKHKITWNIWWESCSLHTDYHAPF